MDRNQIDQLITAIYDENYEIIWNFAEMEIPFDGENFNRYSEKVLTTIMKKIELGGEQEYFLSQDPYLVSSIVKFSSNKELIKNFIENNKYEIGSYELIDLIIKTKDPDYIKYYIENRHELDLTDSLVINLIIATNDSEYIKSAINNNEKSFNFSNTELLELILSTKDINYIKEQFEKINFDILNISNIFDKADYIIILDDKEFIRKCIENKDELGLNDDELRKLVLKTENIDFIKEYTKDEQGYRELIEKCFETKSTQLYDVEFLYKLIVETKDIDFIQKYLETEEDFHKHIGKLILETEDLEFIKKCEENKGKLQIDDSTLSGIIIGTKSVEHIKECISKSKELGLSNRTIADLIIGTEDIDYIKQCLTNDEFEFDEKEKVKMQLIIDPTLIMQKKEYDGKRIKLPENLTIGIEIESIGTECDFLEKYRRVFLKNWMCKKDESLQTNIPNQKGIEATSPILVGDNDNRTLDIFRTCTIMQALGQTINDTCGGHIHFGGDFLTNVKAWQNLIDLWSNTEKILYIIGNEEGTAPREGVGKFAEPISGELEESINNGSVNLNDIDDLKEFKKVISESQKSRYKGLNFSNLHENLKGTVEVRLGNGTVNFDTWVENINLFGGIICSMQELSVIQEKPESEITEAEKEKIRAFDLIVNGNLSDIEKLEELLKIAIPQEDRDVYRQRYETNSKLIEGLPERKNEIDSKIAKGKIKISKDNIGRAIFTGPERITGSEMQYGNQVLEQTLQNQLVSNQIGE